MLPVSGAEQLSASGPMMERPASSIRGAYSRLVRPAPQSPWVMKRFHRPSSRAFACRSRITCGCSCGLAAPGDLRVVDRLGGEDVLVHERPAGAPAGRASGRRGSKSTAPQCRRSARMSRAVRIEPADGVRQPFLVGVVVAALEVPAQVVAHDRGHLVAAQGVEPRRGRRRGRPSAAYAATSSSAPGSPGTSRPTPGKLAPSAKTRNQPSSTRGSPTLQISQSMSATGSVPRQIRLPSR